MWLGGNIEEILQRLKKKKKKKKREKSTKKIFYLVECVGWLLVCAKLA